MSDDEHEKLAAHRPTPALPPPQARPELAAERLVQFSEFYSRFTPRLVRFLMWHGADLHVAADVAQETMRRAYQDWRKIQHPEAWVRVVAGRELTRRMIDQQNITSEQLPERPALLADPAALNALSEERTAVLAVLRQLPPRQRQVMAWTCDGYSPQEIAAILQITDEAVRSNLYKARKALTQLLRHGKVAGDD